MALRHRGWKGRFLALGTGLLLSASVGCTTPDNSRQAMAPIKSMGPGNVVSSPPVSPAYNNIAGGQQNAVAYNPNSPNFNPQMGNPALVQNRAYPNMPMQGVSPPFNPMSNQASFGQGMAQPQPNYNTPPVQVMPANYPQQQQGYIAGYPVNNQGYPVQGMPMQNMPMQNMPMQTMPVQMPIQTMPVQTMPVQNQNMPPMQYQNMQPIQQMQPTYAPPTYIPAPVNPIPLSSNHPMNDLRLPDQMPTSLRASSVKEVASETLQVAGTSVPTPPVVTLPGEPRKTIYATPTRKPEPVVNVVQPPAVPEEVIPAPITVIK